MMIQKSKIPIEIREILKRLGDQGYKSFIVGGAVRDLLLGKIPNDYDICTGATPDKLKDIFHKVIDTGVKFGTVTVQNGNFFVEVTTFRKGVNGRSLEEDVKSRDFTINGLLFDGENLIDLVGGLKDLTKEIIRAIENPHDRFKEDALRMLRAVRLRCQLGFEIEDVTFRSIYRHAHMIQGVAQERIRDELVKILISDQPADGLRILHDTGLLKFILPELDVCYNFDQKNFHHDKNVFDHILAVIDNTPNDLILRLSALLHDIAKPQTFALDENGVGHFYLHNLKGEEISKTILTRLKFDGKTIDIVGTLVREHMSKLSLLRGSTIKRLINRVGRENIFKLIDLQIADEKGSAPPHNFKIFEDLKKEIDKIFTNNDPLTLGDLAIGGRDLQELGFQPGPDMGKVLNMLLNRVIKKPKLNKKEILVK
ncbi:MAG: CCA tRNA nucleotidyltransferase [Dehalobacterium sp.]